MIERNGTSLADTFDANTARSFSDRRKTTCVNVCILTVLHTYVELDQRYTVAGNSSTNEGHYTLVTTGLKMGQ